MANIFGKLFCISTWGESHGSAIGAVIDGCPPQLPLSVDDIQAELDRRKPGQSSLTTSRKENDRVQILSGVENGLTLGTPISLLIPNQDAKPKDYENMQTIFRPSHADYTYEEKFGIRMCSGGGRASARETAARVAAGAIAKKILTLQGVQVRAYVERVGAIAMPFSEDYFPSLEAIDAHPVRCPHPEIADQMAALISETQKSGDSLGGAILCRVRGLPAGIGAPVFDRLEGELAKAMLSIPASKAFEIGSGFSGTYLLGSEHNDAFIQDAGKIRTETNRAGGVLGGISTGEALYMRIGFKPTSTISKAQKTVDRSGKPVTLEATGRHDPCVLPRAVPIVESMAALTLVEHWMQHTAQTQSFYFSKKDDAHLSISSDPTLR